MYKYVVHSGHIVRKKKRKRKERKTPTIDALKRELDREKYKKRYRRELWKTICILIVVAAVSVLIATIWMPVLEIYGTSMTPTLNDCDIVVSIRGDDYEPGDLVAFYIGNKLLVKRFIADAGQWVNIDGDGNVYVDGELLDEPYLEQKALGDANIPLPYQVPENRIFVLGDHRETSADSRNTAVGCIAEEQTIGKIVLRIWPIQEFGILSE